MLPGRYRSLEYGGITPVSQYQSAPSIVRLTDYAFHSLRLRTDRRVRFYQLTTILLWAFSQVSTVANGGGCPRHLVRRCWYAGSFARGILPGSTLWDNVNTDQKPNSKMQFNTMLQAPSQTHTVWVGDSPGARCKDGPCSVSTLVVVLQPKIVKRFQVVRPLEGATHPPELEEVSCCRAVIQLCVTSRKQGHHIER